MSRPLSFNILTFLPHVAPSTISLLLIYLATAIRSCFAKLIRLKVRVGTSNIRVPQSVVLHCLPPVPMLCCAFVVCGKKSCTPVPTAAYGAFLFRLQLRTRRLRLAVSQVTGRVSRFDVLFSSSSYFLSSYCVV